MQKASETFDGHPGCSMSAVRAVTPYQYPTTTCIQNPGPAMYPRHPQTYNMPGSPAWPFQPWGENIMPSMSTTYQGAPYPGSYPQGAPYPGSYPQGAPYSGSYPQGAPYPGSYSQGAPYPGSYPQGAPYPGSYPQGAPYPCSYPQYIPTPHHMTHPQMPRYNPYNMTHPQSMPQTPQYSSFSHPMTHLNTRPQAPQYASPYQYPVTPPKTVTQKPQYMVHPPYHMIHPQTMPNSKVYSLEIKEKNYQKKGIWLTFDSKTSQWNENFSSESSSEDENSEGDNNNKSELNNESSNDNVSDDASESNNLKDVKNEEKIIKITSSSSSSEDENSEGDNNNKLELNNESSNENVSDDANESNNLKDVKNEEKIIKITQETTDTKESSKLKGENYPLKSKCTKSKTSKKKKKKQKNKSVVKDEGSCISKEPSPVTNASQGMENKKELQKLKDGKNFLAQYGAVITEVHCTMGKLRTQYGTEYYFPPALCFLYGVNLTRVELWHVLIEGQQVKVTLDLTSPENPKVTRVTVEEENPDHDTTTTVLDLEKWCSANSVPEKAILTLIEQVKGLHDS